jgi:hypothetical protein
MMLQPITINVVQGDAVSFPADVLVVKHAQIIFGLDRAVAERYAENRGDPNQFILPPGEISLFPSLGAVAAQHILAAGVLPHYQLGYSDIRTFGRDTIVALSQRAPTAAHFVTTVHGLHGSRYYLDEAEAVTAQIAGYIDALVTSSVSCRLNKITIIECIPDRAKRISKRVQELFPDGLLINGNSVNMQANGKPSIFVAMPFRIDFEDVFEYGILSAAHSAGYICERADKEIYTGDVLNWVKERIRLAELVIADVTDANPNVYLEVGFAWGAGVKTLLVVRDTKHLKFDLQGQRCLEYSTIKQLNQLLIAELPVLTRQLRPSTTSAKSH